MLELALKGSRRYWMWISFLMVLIGIGAAAYYKQIVLGLETTGMSRDVSWGFISHSSLIWLVWPPLAS